MIVNDTYIPYLANTDRYLVLLGGAGSGKSIFAGQKLLLRLTTEPDHKILIARKVGRTLKESVYNQMKALIAKYGLTNEFEFNGTEKTMHHTLTGNSIVCVGMDDPEKLKSIHGITGIWIEEATEMNEDDFDQLDLRLRGQTSTYKQIILTFNPININHWLKGRFVDNKPDNATVLQTTYRDNLLIDDEYRVVLESKAAVNPNYHRIYMEGEWGLPEVDRPWMYAFDGSQINGGIELNPRLPVYLSFDFNIDPMTCTAHQFQYPSWYHTLYEFRSSNTGTAELCRQIKGSPVGGCHFIVTGDATGRSRTALGGNMNNYTLIANELGLTTGQMKVPSANPKHTESRPLSNSIMARYPNRAIHPRCKYLIADLESVEGDDKDSPKPPSKDMGHLLDTLRYMDYSFMHRFILDSVSLNKR